MSASSTTTASWYAGVPADFHTTKSPPSRVRSMYVSPTNPSTNDGESVTRKRQANGVLVAASSAASPARRCEHVPGYAGGSCSACGALAAEAMSERVQVHG